MGDGDCRRRCCQRAAQGARGVALNDDKRRPVGKQRCDGAGYLAGMGLWVGTARTVQAGMPIALKAMLIGTKRMLAGKDQARLEPAAAQGSGDRCKLDCFWASSDDNVDTRTGQPSP